ARTDGESIGLLLFRGAGPELFVAAIDGALRTSEGLKSFYLRVIDQLAKSHRVETATIEGLSWGEVDYPADLQRADRLVADGRLGGTRPLAGAPRQDAFRQLQVGRLIDIDRRFRERHLHGVDAGADDARQAPERCLQAEHAH